MGELGGAPGDDDDGNAAPTERVLRWSCPPELVEPETENMSGMLA